jgi:hypothetical protein
VRAAVETKTSSKAVRASRKLNMACILETSTHFSSLIFQIHFYVVGINLLKCRPRKSRRLSR